MAQSRTYLFARLWQDYTKRLDVTKFESFPDPDLGIKLDRVAAKWIREHLGNPSEIPVGAWASSQPEPDPGFLSTVDAETQTTIGLRYLLPNPETNSTPRHPTWALIHAETSLANAKDIATTLEQSQELGFPFQIALLEQRLLPTPDSLRLERQLEDWDKVNFDFSSVRIPGMNLPSPLKRLREEAVKLSAILSKMPSPSQQQPPEVKKPQPALEKPKLHEGHRLAAMSLVWLSHEHPQAKTRREQYAHLRECPAYLGLVLPEFASWEKYCRDLKPHGRGADEKADVVE